MAGARLSTLGQQFTDVLECVAAAAGEPKRIEVRGSEKVVLPLPIYEFSDGRAVRRYSHFRQAQTGDPRFSRSGKIEARKLINGIASGQGHDAALTIFEVEDYRLAKTKLVSVNVSLIQVAEEWIAGRANVVELREETPPGNRGKVFASKEVGA